MNPCKEHILHSTFLTDEKRRIQVHLPLCYEEQQNREFPVLYMHDGQNMNNPSSFSGYSWDISRSLYELEKENKIEPIIVVGIDAHPTMRVEEYTVNTSKMGANRAKRFLQKNEFSSLGHSYTRFLVEDVHPFVTENYRISNKRCNIGVFGSSCGANISFHAWLSHPDVFGVVDAFSLAYWLIENWIFDAVKHLPLTIPSKIYHDMGTKEMKIGNWWNLRKVKKLQRLLLTKGFGDNNLMCNIDEKATHTELFWQLRFQTFVAWAFPIKKIQEDNNVSGNSN